MSDPDLEFVWIDTGPGRKTLVSKKELERMNSESESIPLIGYTDYDKEKSERIYGEKFEANQDLRSKTAEKTWYNYFKGTTSDGRYVEGPRPFKSHAERREYCKRYGFGMNGE